MKSCSNIHCYGSRAVFPCYTHIELKELCKKKGIKPLSTKKEMCEILNIPYYSISKLMKMGFVTGKYEYPSCNIFSSGDFMGAASKVRSENRLLGLLLYNLIQDNLEHSLIESDDEKSISTIDFDKFNERVPKGPFEGLIANVYFIEKIQYVVEKVTKYNKTTEEQHKKIALAYLPFCAFIYENQYSGKGRYISVIGSILKKYYPGLWLRYGRMYSLKTELEGYYSIYFFQGGNIFLKSGVPGTYQKKIFPNIEDDLILLDMPYISVDGNIKYIVQDDFNYILCNELPSLFGTITCSELSKQKADSYNVRINNIIINNIGDNNSYNIKDGLNMAEIKRSALKTLINSQIIQNIPVDTVDIDIIHDLKFSKPPSPKKEIPTVFKGNLLFDIKNYTDKKGVSWYLLTGNTYKYKNDIKKYGGFFNKSLKGWLISIDNLNKLMENI
jgi:hypothetical protein